MFQLFLSLSLFFSANIAFAADAGNYARAYKTCSPKAHEETMRQCNYAWLVEANYVACMKESGFNPEDEIASPAIYDKYLETHKICTSVGNSRAQQQCSYGVVYRQYYDICMRELGFGSDGEELNGGDSSGKKPDGPTNKQQDGFVSKFIDSLF